jgi:hypothetical protein
MIGLAVFSGVIAAAIAGIYLLWRPRESDARKFGALRRKSFGWLREREQCESERKLEHLRVEHSEGR